MTARNLLSLLRGKGVEIKSSGTGRLVIDAPKGTITSELREALASNKAELLRILQAEQLTEQPSATTTVPSLSTAGEIAAQSPLMPKMAPVSEAKSATTASAEDIARLEVELMRLRTEE